MKKQEEFDFCVDCKKKISKYSIRCKSCSNKFRKGKYEWSDEARNGRKGKSNPNFKLNTTNQKTGRTRAWNKFKLHNPKICNRCKKPKTVEIHHINGNTLNNNLENIKWLCRSCHMNVDGRIMNLKSQGEN